MTRLVVIALLTALVSSGCSSATSSAGSGPGPSANVSETETGGFIRLNNDSKSVSVTLDAPPDKVWKVLPAVYGRLGISTEISDAFARMTGTTTFTQSRLAGKRTLDWIRCGNQGAGPSAGGMYRIRLSISSTARAGQDGKTDLVTDVSGTATRMEGTSTGAVACVSTGELEQRIVQVVMEELSR